jgi:hypothetical protein
MTHRIGPRWAWATHYWRRPSTPSRSRPGTCAAPTRCSKAYSGQGPNVICFAQGLYVIIFTQGLYICYNLCSEALRSHFSSNFFIGIFFKNSNHGSQVRRLPAHLLLGFRVPLEVDRHLRSGGPHPRAHLRAHRARVASLPAIQESISRISVSDKKNRTKTFKTKLFGQNVFEQKIAGTF